MGFKRWVWPSFISVSIFIQTVSADECADVLSNLNSIHSLDVTTSDWLRASSNPVDLHRLVKGLRSDFFYNARLREVLKRTLNNYHEGSLRRPHDRQTLVEPLLSHQPVQTYEDEVNLEILWWKKMKSTRKILSVSSNSPWVSLNNPGSSEVYLVVIDGQQKVFRPAAGEGLRKAESLVRVSARATYRAILLSKILDVKSIPFGELAEVDGRGGILSDFIEGDRFQKLDHSSPEELMSTVLYRSNPIGLEQAFVFEFLQGNADGSVCDIRFTGPQKDQIIFVDIRTVSKNYLRLDSMSSMAFSMVKSSGFVSFGIEAFTFPHFT